MKRIKGIPLRFTRNSLVVAMAIASGILDEEQRYFTDLTAAGGQYYSISNPIALSGDTWVWEVEFSTTSTNRRALISSFTGDSSQYIHLEVNFTASSGTLKVETLGRTPGEGSIVVNDGLLHTARVEVDTATGVMDIYVDGVLDYSTTHTTPSELLLERGYLFGAFKESDVGAVFGHWDGILANVKTTDGSTLVGDFPLDENWTNGNVAVNRAAELGSEEWVTPFTFSGSDWIDNGDGTFSRTGTTSGEVRKELSGFNDGDVVLVEFTSTGGSSVTIQFGGPPTTGDNRIQNILAGTHRYVLTAESFGTNNNMRFISSGSDLTISNISVKQIPSTTPYATATNITTAEFFTQDDEGDWLGEELWDNPTVASKWTDDGNNSYTKFQTGFSRLGMDTASGNPVPANIDVRVECTVATIADAIRLFSSSGTGLASLSDGFNSLTVTSESGGGLWFDDSEFLGSVQNITYKRLLQTV